MRLKGIIHIKGVFGLVFGLLFLFHSPSFAQGDTASVNADTEQVATTDSSAVDSATATDTSSDTASDVSATSSSTPSASVTALTAEEDTGIPAQVYVNFFYYVLL